REPQHGGTGAGRLYHVRSFSDFSALGGGTCKTPMGFQLSSLPQTTSTPNRNIVIRNTTTSTTTVSCTSRGLVVHDTLFSSASVAIRKSANAGMLTMRQASH